MQAGDLSDVEELIHLRAPLTYKDELGLSPISWATHGGHGDIVERLGAAKEERAQQKRDKRVKKTSRSRH